MGIANSSLATRQAPQEVAAAAVGGGSAPRVGSAEWKRRVRAKLDALEVPGVVMEFTPEEAEYAGVMVNDPAFDGDDELHNELLRAGRDLVSLVGPTVESDGREEVALDVPGFLDELSEEGDEEDVWFV